MPVVLRPAQAVNTFPARLRVLRKRTLKTPNGGRLTRQRLRKTARRMFALERRREAMNVLITGGLGVNGAVTARLMVKDGLRPVLMDNRMDLTLMRDIKDQVDIVIGDICDQAALEKAVDDYRVTHIAHLAALMPEPAEANPRLGVKVSTDGTINVLELPAQRVSNEWSLPARKQPT